MPEQERPPYLPQLPDQYSRTAYVPAEPPAAADVPAPVDRLEVSGDALVAAVSAPPPVDAGRLSATEPGEAPAAPESREQERVTLTGRLGQHPRIRTTSKGTLIAQFPLGVKDAADLTKTTWHQVVAFQQRAEQVRDTLTKGDAVEVIGYRHARQIPGRTGPRMVEQIYATVLKPRS